MAFKLTIQEGKGRGQSFDFDAPEVSIGRTDENDVVLYENGVSRRHARIRRGDVGAMAGRWMLEDLQSANGTLLNGEKIASEPLEDGDEIRIASTVFRFENADAVAAPRPPEGSTRIVSLKDAQKPAEGDTRAKARAPAAPAAASNSKALGIAAAVLVVVVIASAAFLFSSGKRRSGALAQCIDEIEFSELQPYVFGSGVDSACDAGRTLTLTWVHPTRSRAIVNYAPFYTDSGELEIVLNGTKVADAPLAPSRHAVRHQLVLPDAQLKDGAKNVLQFHSVATGDRSSWGVERLELEVIALNEADLAKAQEHSRLAEARLRERNVAAPNLYTAWTEFRKARRYMEGLDPKPPLYQVTLDRIRETEVELDKVCREWLFVGLQKAKYHRYDEANRAYDFLLAAFPGNDHTCRRQAEMNYYYPIDGASASAR